MTQLDLCQDCYQQIAPISDQCRCCAEPFEQPFNGLCGHCLKQAPFFDKVFALTLYQNQAKTLLSLLKHRHYLASSKVIAQLLAYYWQQVNNTPIDVVTYVPSHPLKKRQRGFNQSYLIAKHFCALSGLVLSVGLVERIKWSKNQLGLSRKKRISNIKNSFKVKSNNLPKRILLIDDVVTTGSTVNEVAKSLKKAGAQQVFVLTFARTKK